MTTLVTIRPNLSLEAEAAASWARMERDRGRPLDVNRSTVSRDAQMKLYLDYVEGRSDVLALHPDDSWHCLPRARAVDTDDHAWIRNRPAYGWRFVVPSEAWHAQYYPHLDQYRGQGFPAGFQGEEMDPQLIKDAVVDALTDWRPFPNGRNLFDQMNFIAGMTAIAANKQLGTGAGATADEIVDELVNRLKN